MTADTAPIIAPGFRWAIGTRVRKIRGSSWQGRICGFYITEGTPEGYAVESEREPGSVQIYPATALELVEPYTPGAGHRGEAVETKPLVPNCLCGHPYGATMCSREDCPAAADLRFGRERVAVPLADGWTPHDGGPCPVQPGTRVRVKYRDYLQHVDRASWFYWGRRTEDPRLDIIAYKVEREDG